MNKIILGTAAGVVLGYFIHRIKDKAYFKKINGEINGLGLKAKKKLNNVLDTEINDAECAESQLEAKINN